MIDAHSKAMIALIDEILDFKLFKKPEPVTDENLIVELRNIRTDMALSGNDWYADVIGFAITALGGQPCLPVGEAS